MRTRRRCSFPFAPLPRVPPSSIQPPSLSRDRDRTAQSQRTQCSAIRSESDLQINLALSVDCQQYADLPRKHSAEYDARVRVMSIHPPLGEGLSGVVSLRSRIDCF